MPTLSIETTRAGRVTFVEVFLEADRPHRVRVESRLDGPVLPPREAGRPAEGWDATGVTRVVETGVTPLGFATTAPIREPAVELVDATPVTDETLPVGVASWVARIESRVDRAKGLAAAEGLSEATTALEALGGLAEAEALAAALARDRRLARELSVVPSDLEERLERVDLPVEALATVATGGRGRP